MLIVSPVPLEAFSEIKMAMSLQLLGSDSTDIYARVINIEEGAHGQHCSLEFTSIDMQGQQTIKRFVDNMLHLS